VKAEKASVGAVGPVASMRTVCDCAVSAFPTASVAAKRTVVVPCVDTVNGPA
jgi:hypothetical protein